MASKSQLEGVRWMPPVALFMPRYGTLLRLKKAWTFKLHYEHRNKGLFEVLGKATEGDTFWYGGRDRPGPIDAGLPAGTVLKVDRVYIRKHDGKSSDYDSITFQIVACPNKTLVKRDGWGTTRFWVKLDDANHILAEVNDERRTEPKKPSPNLTGVLTVGDIIVLDYVANKNARKYVTHTMCKQRYLVLAVKKEHIVCFKYSSNAGEIVFLTVGEFYVIKKHVDSVRDELLHWAKTQGRQSYNALCKLPQKTIDKWADMIVEFPEIPNEYDRRDFTTRLGCLLGRSRGWW